MLLDVGDAVSHFCLPLGVLVKRFLDIVLCLLDGGQPGVEAGMIHLLVMVAHWLIMVAIGKKGHTSSLMAAQDFFVGLLLIVVEVVIFPLLT